MPVKYRLVLRKNMGKVVPEGKEKLYYAQTRAAGTCTFDDLCEQIAGTSTASSGDVKLVIDRLNKCAIQALTRGEVVQMGELGNFQLLLGSKGADTEELFAQAMLKKPRLCFRPGAKLKDLAKTVKSERFVPDTVTVNVPCDKPHAV